MRIWWMIGVLVGALVVANPAHSSVRSELVPGEITEHLLALLDAAGLLDTYMTGQRPLSRVEVARLIREADAHYAHWTPRQLDSARGLTATNRQLLLLNQVDAGLAWLHETYATELRATHDPSTLRGVHVTPWQQLAMTQTALDQDPRVIPGDVGLGIGIEAGTTPLTDHEEGRQYRDGPTTAFESWHAVQLSPYLHFTAQPRFSATVGTEGDWANPFPQRLYLTAGSRAVAALVGRTAVLWGPGDHGGLALSDNVRPLDQLRIGTPTPFQLPGIFRHLGHWKVSVLGVHLGNDRTIPNAVLTGYRVDWLPHRTFTFGTEHLVMLGGRGARAPNVGEAMASFFGLPFGSHRSVDANHMFAIDLHARIPAWRGTSLYLQWLLDNPSTQARLLFDHDAGWLIGAHIPRLSHDGLWTLRAEFARIGRRVYRHEIYTSGWTLNGRVMGAPAGPDSHRLEVQLGHTLIPHSHTAAIVRVTQRRGDQYRVAGGEIDTERDLPDEWSTALLLDFRHTMTRHPLTWRLCGGYEHVWNANFVGGEREKNVRGEIGLTLAL
ncbi:MAG: hypothetical protein HYV02_01055 [Deltaproteobacteria bacterium]|nr:hypothetical protein [Deltaproteobacteria bacterium]